MTKLLGFKRRQHKSGVWHVNIYDTAIFKLLCLPEDILDRDVVAVNLGVDYIPEFYLAVEDNVEFAHVKTTNKQK